MKTGKIESMKDEYYLKPCPDQLNAEADAIRVLSKLIVCKWEDLCPTKEEMQDLLNAIYGLDILIRVHAQHTEDYNNTAY